MSDILEQVWATYSKNKYDLDKSLTDMYDTHDQEMSSLVSKLVQSGQTSTDDLYTLKVDTLLAEQTEAQEELRTEIDNLASGSQAEVLSDPYYEGSHGDYLYNQAKSIWAADPDNPANPQPGESINADANDGFGYTEDTSMDSVEAQMSYLEKASFLDLPGARDTITDLDVYYTSVFGAYTPSADEVSSEASAASMAQVSGVSGGQRSVKEDSKMSNNPVSLTGGNMFVGASTDKSKSKWW